MIKRRLGVLAAIAAGGVAGAEARYAATLAEGSFPWLTLTVNAVGCLLIGVLMVVMFELTAPHRLVRPLLGIGVLGGFTTFSAYAVGIQEMIFDERLVAAAAYLVTTPLIALAATWLGMTITTALISRRRKGA